MARAEKFPKIDDENTIISFMSDTEDEEFPVFREKQNVNSSTTVTVGKIIYQYFWNQSTIVLRPEELMPSVWFLDLLELKLII